MLYALKQSLSSLTKGPQCAEKRPHSADGHADRPFVRATLLGTSRKVLGVVFPDEDDEQTKDKLGCLPSLTSPRSKNFILVGCYWYYYHERKSELLCTVVLE